MRINCSDDEEFGGQFVLWEANCRRSIKGRHGQAALRELRDVLLSLPSKRLIAGALEHDGEFCAIGAYAKAKGVDLGTSTPEDDNHDAAGVKAGMPRLVAWTVVYENDEAIHYEPPEARYARMLRWVESCLAK